MQVRYWDGAVAKVTIAASAPFTMPCMELVSAEYRTDHGKVYVWDGTVHTWEVGL